MTRFVFAFALLSAVSASAQESFDYKACVETCVAYADGPGYELRSCLARCEEKRSEFEGAALGFRESEIHALRCQYEPSLCQ